MATFTLDKVSRNANAAEFSAAEQDPKLHTGPVARLLAYVTRWSSDYAHYQMDSGNWRNLGL